MKTITNRTMLRHANVLNAAKEDLSRDQKRVLYICLKEIQSNGWPSDGLFRIKTTDYSGLYGVVVSEASRDLNKALKAFKGQSITLFDTIDGVDMIGEVDWTTSRWESVKKERGFYCLKLNDELQKYLMPVVHDLPFTISFLEEVCRLRYKYSQRLYGMLNQFRTTGVVYTSSQILIDRWNLPDSYKKISLMKMRVIDPAVEELRRFDLFKTLTYSIKNSENTISIMFNFDPLPE